MGKGRAVVRLDGDICTIGIEPPVQPRRSKALSASDGRRPGSGPFSDSYHKVSLDCDVLSWRLGETRLRLEGPPGSSRSTAILFSEDFFEKELFQQMQGIDPVHPLVRVRNHVKATGDSTFTSQQLARGIRLSEPKTRAMMIRMAHDGYLEMNLSTREARAMPKLFEDLANAGRRDYDVLFFRSEAVGVRMAKLACSTCS